MTGPTAHAIRERLDRALKMLSSAEPTDLEKMRELWCVMSDIQLWMQDMERWNPEAAARGEY